MAGEHPVADLSEMTDCTTREPLLADNTSPHPATVLLPPASFPGREAPLTESGVVEPPQSSVVDAVSPLTVRLPKLAEPQQSSVLDTVSIPTVRLSRLAQPQRASAAELLVTVRYFSPATNRDRSPEFLSPQERQRETFDTVGHSLDVSEASPTSLEPNATLDSGTIAEVCGAVSIPVHLLCPAD